MEFLRQNKTAIVVVSAVLLLLSGLIVITVNLSNEITTVANREVPAPIDGAPSSTNPGKGITDPDLAVAPKDPALNPELPSDRDPAPAPTTPAESTPPMRVTIDIDLSDPDILRAMTGTMHVWSETATSPELITVEITSAGYLAVIQKAGFSGYNIVDVRLSQKAAESLGFSSSTPTTEFTLVVGK